MQTLPLSHDVFALIANLLPLKYVTRFDYVHFWCPIDSDCPPQNLRFLFSFRDFLAANCYRIDFRPIFLLNIHRFYYDILRSIVFTVV